VTHFLVTHGGLAKRRLVGCRSDPAGEPAGTAHVPTRKFPEFVMPHPGTARGHAPRPAPLPAGNPTGPYR
jgi:hypothetical protein